VSKPDFDSHPDESLALSATCSCGDTYQPMTINGDLVDWCGTCRRWTPVPRRGVRTHEQRDEMEAVMASAATIAMRPARPVNVKARNPISVGARAA
jgi:hypothetical protein